MGGWMGNDFFPPLIFFSSKYDNKQLEFIQKMCLKVALLFR